MAKLPNIIEKSRPTWKVVWFVLKESIKGSKRYSLMRYGAVMVDAVFTFAQFGAIAILVNEFALYGISGARSAVLIKGVLLLIASDFVPLIIASISSYATTIQANNLGRYLQAQVFDKLQELDIGTIEQPEFQNILEITKSSGWKYFHTIIWHLTRSFAQIISCIVATIALISISPKILVILFIAAAPSYFIERKNGVRLHNLYKESSEKNRAAGTKSSVIGKKDSLIELSNFNIITVFKRKYLAIIETINEKERLIWKSYRKTDLLGKSLLMVAFAVSLSILLNSVILGTLAVGSLVFGISVINRFQGSIGHIFDTLGKMAEYKKSVDTMMDFLETKPLVVSGERHIDSTKPVQVIFKNVSFKYPGSDKKILSNISLDLKPEDNIAIVGLNGAGKTTLLKLLTRVYDPTSGEILVNGINLKEYDLKSWKRCMGILFQEYATYSEETIAENIMLGDIKKSDQVLVEASAREATAHDFIQVLPDTYNQKIGTEFRGGVELSKGQKQKLALARVLYRNAPIIILDEPTAAIDALSEDVIFKNLKTKHTHQTRVIISHKFSNVRDADRIILIEHGKIIEQGSHDELMGIETGKYKELFKLQAEGYQDKPKKRVTAQPRKKTEVVGNNLDIKKAEG